MIVRRTAWSIDPLLLSSHPDVISRCVFYILHPASQQPIQLATASFKSTHIQRLITTTKEEHKLYSIKLYILYILLGKGIVVLLIVRAA